MRKSYSKTLVGGVVEKFSESFTIDRGTEVLSIVDALVVNKDVAKSRAESIFLDQSFTQKVLRFSTYHMDGYGIDDITQYEDELYKIVASDTEINGAKIEMIVEVKRWV